MFLPEDFSLDPADKKTYAQGRMPGRTYIHKSFKFKRAQSRDNGQPARFVVKVFDTEAETIIERDLEGWTLKETPKGRYQFTFLLAREAGNIKEIWIERIPAPGVKSDIKLLLSLNNSEDIQRFFELVDIVRTIEPQGSETIRVDDGMLRDILASSGTLEELYRQAPEKFRCLIENDVTANDVFALASRREAVNKFARMLYDDEFFDSLIPTEGSGKQEGVWQKFFERLLYLDVIWRLLLAIQPQSHFLL